MTDVANKNKNASWIPYVKQFLSEYPSYRAAEKVIGMSRNLISLWVNGTSRPSVRESYRIEELTKGRVKAHDLLLGNPYYFSEDDFKNMEELIEKLFLKPLREKLKGEYPLRYLVPQSIVDCIKENTVLSDDHAMILQHYTEWSTKFWEGVKLILEYREKHNPIPLNPNAGWITDDETI